MDESGANEPDRNWMKHFFPFVWHRLRRLLFYVCANSRVASSTKLVLGHSVQTQRLHQSLNPNPNLIHNVELNTFTHTPINKKGCVYKKIRAIPHPYPKNPKTKQTKITKPRACKFRIENYSLDYKQDKLRRRYVHP